MKPSQPVAEMMNQTSAAISRWRHEINSRFQKTFDIQTIA